MPETNNVFISWSGPRSKSAAEALKEWLPTIIQAARPWMSATDIDKGARWREEVTTALDTMKAGIICLTPENLASEWLLFEAGALSKAHDPKTRVWTYLLAGLKPQDIKEPLAMFQATISDKEDTRKLVHSVNENLDAGVAESRLNHLFDKLWPDLEQKLHDSPEPAGAIPPRRSIDEIAADTLQVLRALAPLIQGVAAEIDITRQVRLAEERFRNAIAQLPGNTVWTTSLRNMGGTVPLSSLAGDININAQDSLHTSESTGTPTNESKKTLTLPSSPRRRRPLPSGKARRREEPPATGGS